MQSPRKMEFGKQLIPGETLQEKQNSQLIN